MQERGKLLLCLGGSLLIHGLWFCCSPPLSAPGPVSAPVEIGWRLLPPAAVSTAVAPPTAKPVTEPPVASPATPPRQLSAPPSRRPAAEPLPPVSASTALPPAASVSEFQAELPLSDGGETNQASASATAASTPAAVHPAATPAAGGALVEAVPLNGDNPPPVYPRLARQRGWEGLVSLQVRVSALGEVEQAWVESSSGHGVLDQAALTAVQRWRFRPAREGARAVSGLARVPIEFRLRGG